jgi:phospholipid/cholesterol/gamma-HCH transport system ATP-binding protein
MNANASESVLRFENVSVLFDEVRALDNVSFEIKKGETRIAFGAAGSGKSVMLKVALGLQRAHSGRVYVFGEDITYLPEAQLFAIRAKIGVLFQEGGLFDSLTVEENVAYPLIYRKQAENGNLAVKKEEIPKRVLEALRFVELEQTLNKFPSELSGGMRRRVGIARAAVAQPALMLYDSPTAGLDPITANTIIHLIIKARDTTNTTTVIVTHRYQDGHLIANFRYNPQSGNIEHAGHDANFHERTKFMVFREGHLVFLGTEQELERQTDPYISKFKAVRT